jgi:acetamidase/formamidase
MTGMSMGDAATNQGGGKYAINANCSMTGNWKLTVFVRKDGLDYDEDIDFKVQ